MDPLDGRNSPGGRFFDAIRSGDPQLKKKRPPAVTGDRHELRYLKDGRIFISFRDMALRTETKGDWIGWVGTYDDLINRREGQYRVRLMKNNECDCGYSGVEILPDGTVVASTYGEFDAGKPNYKLTGVELVTVWLAAFSHPARTHF